MKQIVIIIIINIIIIGQGKYDWTTNLHGNNTCLSMAQFFLPCQFLPQS